MAATEHSGISLMSQYNIVLPKRQAYDSSGKPIPACDEDQCGWAMKGEDIPVDLSSFWHRRAVIRGIRDSLQFATSPAIIELCSGDYAHQFSRACNARLIMSDIIPDMQDPATQPYCIWYPDLASEETYREVARQYPSMRYQVGRACATACYTDLYKELDLLPDVSIAEESREVDKDKDAEIYKIIMSAPQRYVVMEDFSRAVLETPRTPAFLIGDMKPRWALGQRVYPGKNLPETTADDIDIEEDGFIGLQGISLESISGLEDYAKLGPGQSDQLWIPLPPDLPFLEKRLQTQIATWESNVDRYSRLMHPRRLRTKLKYNCILRSIYHSTSFARWWAYQLETNSGRATLPDKLLSQGNKRECREIRSLQTDLEPRDSYTDHTVSYYDMEIGYGQYQCGNPHEDTLGTYGGGLASAGTVERYMWLSTETAQKLKDELDFSYPGADTGLLYEDEELWDKLSRRIEPMEW
ncbi:hypothetical protein N7478_012746 [Penicillium angulare]|uniref:uncharacterized protein n=1 Tax=Penicillium angulare TaxID=116970 RepID=UPI00253FF710|nr:uncharacterized protein N7478_012746 [Penicillium angulare]KAJ5256642.1 hypothetical protein N7478_012746 [Penicillium angulare]